MSQRTGENLSFARNPTKAESVTFRGSKCTRVVIPPLSLSILSLFLKANLRGAFFSISFCLTCSALPDEPPNPAARNLLERQQSDNVD